MFIGVLLTVTGCDGSDNHVALLFPCTPVTIGNEVPLLKNFNIACRSFDDDTTAKTEAKPTTVLTKQASVDSANATPGVTKADPCPGLVKSENTTPNSRPEEQRNVENEDTTADDDPETPKFETIKEKECWAMYKKMSEKGLPVAYDTILRGMLTPTEYRSIRKEVISS
ncbi:uncharacterized protein CBL_03298 [Carabus blaptoides fortunei]